jgi:glutathione reductase (NADPH)
VTTATSDCDFLVLGGGSAGVRAARVAAELGARVILVEERDMGGTCVNLGCVPKKLLWYAAEFADQWRDARSYGWQVEPPRHDWRALIARKDAEIARLNRIYEQLLTSRGVTIVRGRGRVTGPDAVEVTLAGGERRAVTARHLLIAVGGLPRRPTFPGADLVLVSDDVFHLPALPRRVLIIGGGYISVEMAGIFHGLGAHVEIVHHGPRLLRGFDRDVQEHLGAELSAQGIDLRFQSEVRSVERASDASGGHLRVALDSGAVVEVDAVLAAIGRAPGTRGLGLEEVGVGLRPDGVIEVDEHLTTSVPSIHAAGDVVERRALTPVAIAEGMLIARRLFGGAEGATVEPLHYAHVPSAVFSSPPVATVGLGEEEARAACGAVDIYRSVFRPLKLSMTERRARTLMKIVVDRATGRVLGIHVVGHDAAEIVQGFALAVQVGLTKPQLDATIGIHPTAAEELVTMRTPLPDPDENLEAAGG